MVLCISEMTENVTPVIADMPLATPGMPTAPPGLMPVDLPPPTQQHREPPILEKIDRELQPPAG